MLFTPDERRALLALGGLLTIGLFARLIAPNPVPPEGGGDSLLVVLAAAGDSCPTPPVAEPPPGLYEEGRLRINEADLDALTKLPRVGPQLAKRIVEARAQHGPFRSARDLRRVRGIGPKTAALLTPRVSFATGDSAPPP